MHASRDFLKKCQQLKSAGFEPALEAGMRVARGYADLGFEVFLLVQEEKLLSLHTGEISRLLPEHHAHFFAVPSCDEMVDALLKFGFDVEALNFVEQRHWQLKLRQVSSQQILESQAITLQDVLADALCAACLVDA